MDEKCCHCGGHRSRFGHECPPYKVAEYRSRTADDGPASVAGMMGPTFQGCLLACLDRLVARRPDARDPGFHDLAEQAAFEIRRLTARVAELEAELAKFKASRLSRQGLDLSTVLGFEAGEASAKDRLAALEAASPDILALDGALAEVDRLQGVIVAVHERVHVEADSAFKTDLQAIVADAVDCEACAQ